MKPEIMNMEVSPFEAIRHTNPAGNEFWSSRDFAKVLGYADYRNFQSVIESARTACFNSGQRVDDHFVEVTDMIEIGKGGQRPAKTVMMSRYACYLVIQNADPSKGDRGSWANLQTIRELGGTTIPEELPVVQTCRASRSWNPRPRKRSRNLKNEVSSTSMSRLQVKSCRCYRDGGVLHGFAYSCRTFDQNRQEDQGAAGGLPLLGCTRVLDNA